jgi:hypothetical protein
MADDSKLSVPEPLQELRESIPYGSLGPGNAQPRSAEPRPPEAVKPITVDIPELERREDNDDASWRVSISPF